MTFGDPAAPPLDRANALIVRSGFHAEVPIATWKRVQIGRRPRPTRKEVNGYAWGAVSRSHCAMTAGPQFSRAGHLIAAGRGWNGLLLRPTPPIVGGLRMIMLDWDDSDERWLMAGVAHPRLARFMLSHGVAATLIPAVLTFTFVAFDPPRDYLFAAVFAGVVAGAMVVSRGLLRRKMRSIGDREL